MDPTRHDECHRLRSVQREVLDYLVVHADAKDTLDGIMQWWLVGAHARIRMSDLNAAIEDLIRRGWMVSTSLGPAGALYGLDKTRLEDVREFLAHRTED
jgi:hypothetical protein